MSELRSELVTLVDWNGESVVFFPSFRYSPTDFLELTLGAQIGVGPRLSQYGDIGETGFLIAEFFF